MTIEIDPLTGSPIIKSPNPDLNPNPPNKAHDFTVGHNQTSDKTDDQPVETKQQLKPADKTELNKPEGQVGGIFGSSPHPSSPHGHDVNKEGQALGNVASSVSSQLTTKENPDSKGISVVDGPAGNAPLANLIGEAHKANEELAKKQALERVKHHSDRLAADNLARGEHDATLLTKQALIRTVLKDSGADTMSQNVAYAKIVEILGW